MGKSKRIHERDLENNLREADIEALREEYLYVHGRGSRMYNMSLGDFKKRYKETGFPNK